MHTIVYPYDDHKQARGQKPMFAHMAADQETTEKHADKSKPSSSQKTEAPARKTAVSEKGEKLKKDLDKIMDEIDDVLEENAEEFIKSYVQRGGE